MLSAWCQLHAVNYIPWLQMKFLTNPNQVQFQVHFTLIFGDLNE